MDADDSPRQQLTQLYFQTIVELQPGLAVVRALHSILSGRTINEPLHLLAIGKAAVPMARAAAAWCDTHRIAIAGGVDVSHQSAGSAPGVVSSYTGDHPQPGAASQAAAAAIGTYIETQISSGDRVIVLLSGGASSLIGAPRLGIDSAQYTATIAALLCAGLTIDDMNAIRRKLSRWAGGRLGDALLARGARVNVLVISDVMGDTLAAIGSGPCVPDRGDRDAIESIVERAHVSGETRASLRAMLAIPVTDDVTRSRSDGDEIPHQIISSNREACESVLQLARASGAEALPGSEPIRGDAQACGASIARQLVALRTRSAGRRQRVISCWGGEPTVALPSHNPPAGGRMQALALSAAHWLHTLGAKADRITILAAGTDGRDGTTDAAGAIVDRETWRAIAATGRDPARDLNEFRSHEALATVQALIPAFTSGTNVNDVVIAHIN